MIFEISIYLFGLHSSAFGHITCMILLGLTPEQLTLSAVVSGLKVILA